MCDIRKQYCQQCAEDHMRKMNDGRAHELVAVTADRSLRDCSKYFEGVNKGLDAAEEDLKEKCSQLVEAIQAKQAEGLLKLREIKQAVASDWDMVKRQLSPGLARQGLTLPFVNLLKTQPIEQLPSLFSYQSTLPPSSSIQIAIDYYPLNTYHEAIPEMHELPIIKEECVKLNLETGRSDRLRLPILQGNRRYWSIAYCLKDRDTLFCVDGERGETFSVTLSRPSEVRYYSEDSPLRRQLSCPGVCIAEQLLYVFGGAVEDGSHLKTAQLLVTTPASGRWSRLPDMPNPRSSFNPVPCLRYIYLIGGYHSKNLYYNSPVKIDKYGIDSQFYMELSFREPIKPECSAASFAVGRKIVIISSKSVYILENDSLRLSSDLPKEQKDLTWAQLAVTYQNNIYYYTQKSRGRAIEIFKLDTQSFTLYSFPLIR